MKPLRAPVFCPKSTHSAVLRQRLHRSCPSYGLYTCGFHATSQRPFPDIFLAAHGLLENFRSIDGLPWSNLIPYTAFSVFTLTRCPIATYLHIVLQRQRDIEPHFREARLKLQNTIMRVDADKVAAKRAAMFNVLYQTAARKSHNCQHWELWLVFTKFPVWYVMMETIRRMTGTEKGFIDLVRSAMGKRDFSCFAEPSAFV